MAAEPLPTQHELDAKLAGANMLAWFAPALRLAVRHWLVTLGAGVAALLTGFLVAWLLWPELETWWVGVLRTVVEAVAFAAVVVPAYRIVAARESAGTELPVNDWQYTIVRGVQIAVVWTIGAFLAALALVLGLLAIGAAFAQAGMAGLVALAAAPGVLGFVIFLLMPVWMSLAVASALSTVYAVRSLEPPLRSVLASLRLAFDQKWRVFWPSYLFGGIGFVLYVLAELTPRVMSALFLTLLLLGVTLYVVLTVLVTAYGIAMTFVIERAYTAELGLAVSEAQDPRPAGANRLRPRGGAPAANAAPPLPTAPADIAAQVEQDLRANRPLRLAELVWHGLRADPKFFADYPDSALPLAKRIGLNRPDLAMRVLQPYLKDQRTHPLHLTSALFVADLLTRDATRLRDALLFLEQVKVLYPYEPLVDQLIKSTNRAIAAAAPSGAT